MVCWISLMVRGYQVQQGLYMQFKFSVFQRFPFNPTYSSQESRDLEFASTKDYVISINDFSPVSMVSYHVVHTGVRGACIAMRCSTCCETG